MTRNILLAEQFGFGLIGRATIHRTPCQKAFNDRH